MSETRKEFIVESLLARFALKNPNGVFVGEQAYLMDDDTFVFSEKTYNGIENNAGWGFDTVLLMITPDMAARIVDISRKAIEIKAAEVCLDDSFYNADLHKSDQPESFKMAEERLHVSASYFWMSANMLAAGNLPIDSEYIGIHKLLVNKSESRLSGVPVENVTKAYIRESDSDEYLDEWPDLVGAFVAEKYADGMREFIEDFPNDDSSRSGFYI